MPRSGFAQKNSSLNENNRNLFINGDVQFAQRTGGFTTPHPTPAPIYFFDRFQTLWDLQTGVNTSQSSTATDLPGFLAIGGRDTGSNQPALRTFGTMAGAGYTGHRQYIESNITDEMQTNAFSVGMKLWVSNFQEVRVQIYEPTSPDNYSGASVIESVVIPVTDSSWNFIKLENITSLTTRSRGFGVEFRMQNPSNTGGAYDSYATEFMCNEGPVLERFSTRGGSFAEELQLCQRYYEKSFALATNPTIGTSIGSREVRSRTNGQISDHVAYKVTKRSAPAAFPISTNTGLQNFLRDITVGSDLATTAQLITEHGFTISSGTVNDRTLKYQWTADAEIS